MKRTRGFLLLAMLWFHARAEEPLKLSELVKEAVQNNPELLAAQKRVEAARQRPRQEGALPDPMVSVGYASTNVPLPGFGLGAEPVANIGLMLTQELPYPGKRGLMAARASKEADAELQAYLALERSIVTRVVVAFHKLNHSYEAIDVMHRSQEVLKNLIQLAEARYSAGKGMQQEIFRANSQLALMETRILKMQQDREMAVAEINAILHRSINAPMGRPQHASPEPLASSLAELTKAAEATSPMIAREQKMAEARQYGVSLARKNFKPDFSVSGGYYSMGNMSMYQAQLGVKIPAWRSKNNAALTEQVNALSQARQTYEATSHEVRWRVRELFIAAETSWRLIQLYRDSVLPQVELATASSLASFETGSLDSTQVLMSLMSRFDQEERYHEEMLSYFTALARLEEITGKELLRK